NFRIYGNISNNNIEKVYDLIDHSQRKWKRGEPSGVFSVKIAYKLLLDGVNTTCPRCGGSSEIVDHVFRNCPVTVEMWNELNLGPESVGKYIKELDEVGERMLTRNCIVPEWVPPRDLFVHFNFDAAYDLKEFTSGLGLVTRNIRGEILVTKSTLHMGVASPFATEALACVQAVALGRSMGVDMVEIEGDSLSIIKKCKAKEQDRSKVGALIEIFSKSKEGSQNVPGWKCFGLRKVAGLEDSTGTRTKLRASLDGRCVYL
ncbi:hypothetical protein Goari_021421, partial [Gossypium aridum]|nr:hypothetical protein [Gossypium aridum]